MDPGCMDPGCLRQVVWIQVLWCLCDVDNIDLGSIVIG